MNDYKVIESKYKSIVKQLDIYSFNLYELELLLSSFNVNFQFMKRDVLGYIYLTSNNLNTLYNFLSGYSFYSVLLYTKEKYLTVKNNKFNNDDIKKRSTLFVNIITKLFNEDIRKLNSQVSSKKINFKNMSDEEVSSYKKSQESFLKLKKEFVNIIKDIKKS